MSDDPLIRLLTSILGAFLIFSAIALVLAGIGLLLLYHRLKRLKIDPEAGFWETLRSVPLGLAITLDLLDAGLDFFSAPVSFWLLGKLGLQNLRQVTVIEALIPFTQWLPTMTIAWLVAQSGASDSEEKPAEDDAKVIDVPSSPVDER